MDPLPLRDFSRLCIHTITTKPWSLPEAVARYSRAGVAGVTVWRDALKGIGPREAAGRIREAGLKVVSLCRGGFFPSTTPEGRRKAIDDNLRIIEEAGQLGAPLVVLVCGADPGQDLNESRRQIAEALTRLLPQAEAAGVRLAVEPLHPMYADRRSAINTIRQANEVVEALNSPFLGVAVDVYHLWWDPDLEEGIRRCGRSGRIFAFHISDWRIPTEDLLNDRGLMGEGCIPIRRIRGWVEECGFQGYSEVEIFSTRRWSQDQDRFLEEILQAYLQAS